MLALHSRVMRVAVEQEGLEPAGTNGPEEREDQVVVLSGATWADYQRLLAIRGESCVPRVTYLEGRLEIMNPSRFHERAKSRIGRLVEVFCLHHDIPFEALGSWTLERKEEERGAEPDECYVFGGEERDVPDLALEVVWTRRAISKLEVYRKLGVPEVWIFESGVIRVYVLESEAGREAAYQEVESSRALPQIDLAALVSFLGRPTASEAIKAYRASLG